MNIRAHARRFRKQFDHHTPLITVSLSRENLLHNLRTYKEKYPDLACVPVLKSNAYGHGLIPIAEILDTEDIAFFMVDSFYEARTLRRAGIKSRIAVIGFMRPEEIATSTLTKTDYAVVDMEQLRELATYAKKSVRLHIKIDTGMHRQGIMPKDLDESISLLKSNTNLRVIGVCSHFADADNPESQAHTRDQLAVWKLALARLTAEFPSIEYRHIAATKGVAFSKEAETNVCRIGIGLYGFDTSPDGSSPLKPVLAMYASISSIREVPTGDFVGYNATYTASQPTLIATVPVGYFEGIDRALSNTGTMYVQGKECPIVGRVSMNMSSIDVSSVPSIARGDQVTAISRVTSDSNSVEHMAERAGTTPYVILVHIPQHLKRIVE